MNISEGILINQKSKLNTIPNIKHLLQKKVYFIEILFYSNFDINFISNK